MHFTIFCLPVVRNIMHGANLYGDGFLFGRSSFGNEGKINICRIGLFDLAQRTKIVANSWEDSVLLVRLLQVPFHRAYGGEAIDSNGCAEMCVRLRTARSNTNHAVWIADVIGIRYRNDVRAPRDR